MAFSGAKLVDFVPLDPEGSKQRRRKKQKKKRSLDENLPLDKNRSNVVYVGRIPHGFYEEQMRGFFSQFGKIKRIRISRNKKTGKSKHYGFIQFESPDVVEIVADAMNNYLLFEHLLQVKVVPVEKLHEKLWVGCNKVYQPPNWRKIQALHQDRAKEPEEQQHMLKTILRRQRKRKKKIVAAGIDFEYPDLESLIPSAPKKIKFAYSE